ncbi:MAG: TM0106 family RecB-like putative nuclease [Parcubacteria group bacterium]|nr:TM0106 family RecB-like putative nuclease [Parcubacteria group bacterium]
MSSATTKVTSDHFYKFFLCPHWIWYDLYEDQQKHKHVPAIMKLLLESRVRDSENLFAHKQFEKIPEQLSQDLDEAFAVTLEFMKQGKNIYRPILMHEHWVGTPDFLEARPVSELKSSGQKGIKSTLGDWYYVAYDIRNDPEMKDEYKFPLVFASLILENIQGVRPNEAYILNAEGEPRSFLIEDYVQDFNWTLEGIEKILNGEKPAPFLKSGCKRTPWYSICIADTQGCNDVSLIYRLSQSDQKRLYELGIKTVAQFAETDFNRLQETLRDWPVDKLLRFHNQAQSLKENKMIVLSKTSLPEVENEVYFDIESDPTQSIDYLMGLLIKNGSETPKYKYFLAHDKLEESKIWGEFLKFVEDLDENTAIYHYGYYEKHVLNRLFRKYGGPRELIEKFNDHAFDLHRTVTDSVILPLYFYSLKDVAGYIGFKWTSEDAGGAESVVWYDEWLKTKDEKLLKKLIQYNEDDVRATYALKEWLTTLKPHKVRIKESLNEPDK